MVFLGGNGIVKSSSLKSIIETFPIYGKKKTLKWHLATCWSRRF